MVPSCPLATHHAERTYFMGRALLSLRSWCTAGRSFQKKWDLAENYIDAERFKDVQSRLKIQARDAVWWKDACLLYFQEFSGMRAPYEMERPIHELDDLKQVKLPIDNHECPTPKMLNERR